MKKIETSKRILIRYFILLVIIPVISFISLQYIYSIDQIKNQIVNHDLVKVEKDQKLLSTEINMIENIVNEISKNKLIIDFLYQDDFSSINSKAYADYLELDHYFDELNSTKFKINNIFLIHPNNGFYRYKKKIYLDENDLYKQKWYTETMKKEGSIYWMGENEDRAFCLAKLIIDPKKYNIIGMLYIEIYNETFKNLFTNDEERKLYLLNQENEILLSNDKEIKQKIFPLNYVNSNGVLSEGEYLYLFSSKSPRQFRVVEKIILADLFQQLRTNKYIIIIGVAVCLLLFFVYLMNIINKLTKPLNEVIQLINGEDTYKYSNNKNDACYELAKIKVDIANIVEKNFETDSKLIKINNELKKAEIHKLQATINPHFLYNILTSIKYMALEKGQEEKISRIISSLINLLRQSINRDGIMTTVNKELKSVSDYMKIMNELYEGYIDFNIYKENQLDGVIPNFILQPIVENAINHGIDPTSPGGVINIKCFIEGGNLIFKVEDNGKGIEEEYLNYYVQYKNNNTHNNFTNIGLYAIHKKIQLLYGQQYGLTLKRLKQGTSVMICIPYQKMKE